MKKAKEITSMQIMQLPAAKRMGKVLGVVLDADRGKVMALIVRKDGVLRPMRRMAFNSVVGIGADAVTVDETAVFEKLDDGQKVEAGSGRPLGMTLMAEDGEEIGTIDDVVFNENNGEILGYEIRVGLLKDALEGPSYLPAEAGMKVGEDAAVVSREGLERMQPGESGLSSLAVDIRKVTIAAGAVVAEKVADSSEALVVGRTVEKDILDDAGKPIVMAGDEVTAEAAAVARQAGKLAELAIAAGLKAAKEGVSAAVETAADATGKALLGKTAARDLKNEDGEIIVPEGAIIGEAEVEAARQAGRLQELVLATGMGVAADVAGSAVSSARQMAATALIGQVAGKTVIDDDGLPIVTAGQMIQEEEVELARSKGKLGSLMAAAVAAKLPGGEKA